ncbi:TPA: hypothetical protein SLE35_000002 [Morganella morganii]|nr:hypothetical protein [Morganella morganii]
MIIFRKINGKNVPIKISKIDNDTKNINFNIDDRIIFDTKKSYTIPNVSCRTCSKRVFFYANAFGSKVLFDSLGPPWPIHPCFEKKSKEERVINKEKISDGCWEPVIVINSIFTSSGNLRVEGYIDKLKIQFTINKKSHITLILDNEDIKYIPIYANKQKMLIQLHNSKTTYNTKFRYRAPSQTHKIDIKAHLPHEEYTCDVKKIKRLYIVNIYFNGKLVKKYPIQNNFYRLYFGNNNSLKVKKYTHNGDIHFKALSITKGLYIQLPKLKKIHGHYDYNIE